MTNILFVSHSSELNGAERFLLDVLENLDKQRFDPLLVIPRPGPLGDAARKTRIEVKVIPMKWWLTEGSRVWKQPLAWTWNLRGVRHLAALIRERGVGLVFTNSAATFGGALAAGRAGVAHVWFVHEVLDGDRPILKYLFGQKRLVRFIHRRSKRVLVNSRETLRAFCELPGVDVVSNGISPRAPAASAADLRKEWGFGDDDLILGLVGKIGPDKGQREAVLALDALVSLFPRLKLVLVGAVKDIRYERQIKEIIHDRGLGGRVVFAGYREDLPLVFSLLMLLVVASRVESFGRAALEAMAAGVPVLAVPCGGIEEIIEDGRTGFLAESRDPEAIARGVARALENPERTREIVASASRFVLKNFALSAQVRKLEDILEDCLVR